MFKKTILYNDCCRASDMLYNVLRTIGKSGESDRDALLGATSGACMNARKYKILVVDDDPDIREIVVSFLSSEGHLCHVAKDGAEALDKTHNDHFDALITDFRMPRMNGIALAGAVLKTRSVVSP